MTQYLKMDLHWFLSSCVLICLVLLLRRLLRGRISARWQYALWLVVLARLLIPGTLFSAPFSLDALTQQAGLEQAVDDLRREITPTTEVYSAPYEQPETPFTPEEYAQQIQEEFPYHFRVYGAEEAFVNAAGNPYPSDTQHFILTVEYMIASTPFWRFLWEAGVFITACTLIIFNRVLKKRLYQNRRPISLEGVPLPVYAMYELHSPCLFGLFKPTIYLTRLAAEDETTRAHVLAHELTHYAHRDHIWSALRCLALALHWYNPLVWLAVVLSRRDGELACDEGAVARLGEEQRIPYGRTLVDMVAQRAPRPGDLLSCSTAMSGGTRTIQQRVALLVKRPQTVKTALFAAGAVLALAAVFVFAGQQEPETAPDSLYPQFLSQVEQAQAIQYSPSPISSQLYPHPILDSDLLEEVKTILETAQPTDRTATYLDQDQVAFLSSSVTLIGEGPSSADQSGYLLYRQDNKTYVVIPTGFGAPNYTPIAELDASPDALASAAKRQQERNQLRTLPLAPTLAVSPGDTYQKVDYSFSIYQSYTDKITDSDTIDRIYDLIFREAVNGCLPTAYQPLEISQAITLNFSGGGTSTDLSILLQAGANYDLIATFPEDEDWTEHPFLAPTYQLPAGTVEQIIQAVDDWRAGQPSSAASPSD